MKNKKKIILSSLILSLMLISLCSAFGVSSPYWEENPLQMERGETKTIYLNLQNIEGEKDITVEVRVVEGSDIILIDQETYVIKKGTSDTMVPITISVPTDAVPGDTESIKVEFKTVQEESGGISMATGMAVSFDVVAGEGFADAGGAKLTALAIAAIVLIIILWLIIRARKKK